MAGHINAARFVTDMQFPSLALLVSGGHTELVYLPRENEYYIIGETRDDAAGEAYDKVGRVLGLSYPSGKEIDELAHQGQDVYDFPRSMIQEDNLDFSFSGLKSAFINKVHNANQIGETLDSKDLAASFQASVVEVLVTKTKKALYKFPVKQLILAGGVAANQGLRAALTTMMAEEFPEIELVPVPLKLCGDNAAMIGAAGEVAYRNGERASWGLNAEPSLEFPWYDGEMS